MKAHVFFALLMPIVFVACYDGSRSPSEPLDPLNLIASANSATANGFSRVRITAQIDPRSSTMNRRITFRTTAGTFVGAAAPGRELLVDADTNGMASVELQSSTNVEMATVTASVGGVARTVTISFTAGVPGEVIRLSASATRAPGDGATIIQVFADIAPGIPTDQRTVRFTTTTGVFTSTSMTTAMVVADASNRATADLRVPVGPGTTRVTATVANVTTDLIITFDPAPAESLTVDAKPTITAAEEIMVTATLRRVLGAVTTGRTVMFVALSPAGERIGSFRNVRLSDGMGVATALYSAENNPYRGLLTIRATTDGPNGVVSAETTVRIVDPPVTGTQAGSESRLRSRGSDSVGSCVRMGESARFGSSLESMNNRATQIA